MKIFTVNSKKDEKLLRKKTAPFDFASASPKEIRELITLMKKAMKEANGIGLAANQIGLSTSVFIARVPNADGNLKSYAVFNPTLEKLSPEKESIEEGCLSVPGTYGNVKRSLKVTLRGFGSNCKPIKIKAWGLLARVFQHEVDHLNGKLFIDKTTTTHTLPSSERLRNRLGEVE